MTFQAFNELPLRHFLRCVFVSTPSKHLKILPQALVTTNALTILYSDSMMNLQKKAESRFRVENSLLPFHTFKM